VTEGLTARSAVARFQQVTPAAQVEPSSWLPYTDEDEVREAVENFRSYLAILEEWDEREKETTRRRQG